MNETPAFPMAPSTFKGESREVEPGACFDWLHQGWAMFLANPGVWIGSTVLMLVMLLVISFVLTLVMLLFNFSNGPLFAQIVVHLLVPLFGAGMIQICRCISEEKQLKITDIFVGFRRNTWQLVMVGVFFAMGIFGIAFIAFLLVSGGVLGGVVTGRVAGFGVMLGGVMLAGLIVIVLSIPVIMATWFAPALVLFNGMRPAAAMRASFDAGAKNWVAMAIFGIFLVVALFFATLPFFFGLLLLLPVFSGAVYASYRDIFVGV